VSCVIPAKAGIQAVPCMKLREQTSFRQAFGRNPVFRDSVDPGLRMAGVTGLKLLEVSFSFKQATGWRPRWIPAKSLPVNWPRTLS